jgi:hypothetical protein
MELSAMTVSTREAPAATQLAALARRTRSRLPQPAATRAGLPPVLLGVALLAAAAYAAFSDGATAAPAEPRLQVALALVSLPALGALLFGGLRAAAPRTALIGLALLLAFAAWSGLSLAWSTAPDLTWSELNRALAYALVAGLAVALGASLPRAAERTATTYVALATAVAVYALAGKVAPWLVNHTADFSRLRAPLGYWNALALFCALGVPVALRGAADAERGVASRLAFQLALIPLLVTVALTYSRGGIAVAVLAAGLVIAAGPDRVRLLAFAGVAVAAATPALFVAFIRDDLTEDSLSIAARTDDGLLMLAALALGAVAAIVLTTYLRRAGERLVLTERGREVALRGALGAGAACLLLFLAALAFSDRGLTGTISGEVDSFASVQEDKQNDPARLLQANSGNRVVWWEEAGGAFWDRPLAGHGAGAFPLLHLAYRDNDLQVRQAHSVPLQFLAETGLIGTLLALGGLGLLGLAGWRRIEASGGRERAYAIALGAACAGWAAHMWVDWDWDFPALALPLLVFLGVLAARPAAATPAEPAGQRPLSGRTALLAAGSLALCAVAVSALLPALARDRTSEALRLSASGSGPGLVEGAKRARMAMTLNPLSVEPVFAAATLAERRGRYQEASELLEEALDRQPRNPQVWLRIATFNLKRDDYRGVRAARAALLRLDPHNQGAPFLLAVTDPGPRSASATGTPLPQPAAR